MTDLARRVDLVDDDHVRAAEVDRPWVISLLMARAERIGDADPEVRLVEREVLWMID